MVDGAGASLLVFIVLRGKVTIKPNIAGDSEGDHTTSSSAVSSASPG